jgi:hypothetical protein
MAMNIPASLRAGDTYSWTETFADYPASEGYILEIILHARDKAPIVITAAASGDDYAVAISAATSKAYPPGTYHYQAYICTKTDSVITAKYTQQTGQITIHPDLTSSDSQADFRSHAKKVLDAIEALIEGKATADVLSYSIAGRSIAKMSPEELIKWRDFYKHEYELEKQAEDLQKGLDVPNKIGIRFRRI